MCVWVFVCMCVWQSPNSNQLSVCSHHLSLRLRKYLMDEKHWGAIAECLTSITRISCKKVKLSRKWAGLCLRDPSVFFSYKCFIQPTHSNMERVLTHSQRSVKHSCWKSLTGVQNSKVKGHDVTKKDGKKMQWKKYLDALLTGTACKNFGSKHSKKDSNSQENVKKQQVWHYVKDVCCVAEIIYWR